ncbi:hypothetical protein HBB16_09375 [Pseudonocardia sp. MCCB 268]|nr:hypothetical protein [Pseudonocardia cytotoxica]
MSWLKRQKAVDVSTSSTAPPCRRCRSVAARLAKAEFGPTNADLLPRRSPRRARAAGR